jgi:hypothetical protein
VFVKFGSDYWLLRKTAISFAENWIKSPKIVITTKYFLFVILWLQTVDGSVPLLKIGVEKKTVNISGMNPSKQTNKQKQEDQIHGQGPNRSTERPKLAF